MEKIMNVPFKTNNKSGRYIIERPVSSEAILDIAKKLVNRRCARGRALTTPQDSQDFLMLKLSHLEHEVFSVIFLDLCVALRNVKLGSWIFRILGDCLNQLHISIVRVASSN